MKTRIFLSMLFTFVMIVSVFMPNGISNAESDSLPLFDSPGDLIDAVNALRASYGLAPYSINPILMGTAQTQADFMASTGIVSHTGPGGSSVTQRLLAAGYPLAGDLSQGGFRAENIISGSGLSAQGAVNAWTGDAPHLNTMISPNLTEIGAGVSKSGGLVYYVIDCARPTGSGQPQATQPGGAPITPGVSQYISPVHTVTPDQNGLVIHEVKTGQTLWAIAIAYGVKIDDIRRLNGLTGNDIYPGMKLVVRKDPTPTPDLPTITPSPEPSATDTEIATSTSTPIPIPSVVIITATPAPASSIDHRSMMSVAIALVALALLAGGVFMWISARK